MDDPNITIEEYIRLEEEKARRRAIVFNDELTSEEARSCEPMPTVSYFDDLDFFKDFKNKFLAIVYDDALTSKSDFLTEPTIYSIAGSDDENPPPPPPQQTPTQQAPHTVSTIKLPILKKGEYDIWAMKMEHYLIHTDYPIWEVIQKANGHVSVSTNTNGVIKVLPPKTAEESLAREK
ncbi:hypothetical protein Tco_0026508, partial [Tanacetum coccineum]